MLNLVKFYFLTNHNSKKYQILILSIIILNYTIIKNYRHLKTQELETIKTAKKQHLTQHRAI